MEDLTSEKRPKAGDKTKGKSTGSSRAGFPLPVTPTGNDGPAAFAKTLSRNNSSNAIAVGTPPSHEFLTQDPAMQQLLQMAAKIANTDVTVLVLGESGAGKELIARRIHDYSRRGLAGKPIVSINCGALQESLLLSELFGHEKGAFTGALAQKKGLVEVADGGTLFLDEIGEMGLEAQGKLLRFLQEGELYRVGGKTPLRTNVRILSATNKDLETQVKLGKFREDLYYRINTVTLRISPLRKRPGDIPLLIERFLAASRRDGKSTVITPKAMEYLLRYPWPGNVRELQNLLERFKILVEGDTITEEDIPLSLKAPGVDHEAFDGSATLLLAHVEKRHILRVLAHFKGNKTKAANAMGITVKTLYNKLAQYDQERRNSLSGRTLES